MDQPELQCEGPQNTNFNVSMGPPPTKQCFSLFFVHGYKRQTSTWWCNDSNKLYKWDTNGAELEEKIEGSSTKYGVQIWNGMVSNGWDYNKVLNCWK